MRARSGMFVWSYTFIDCDKFCQKPDFSHERDDNIDGDSYAEAITKYKEGIAKKAFRECGWEGDGEIQVIWIPPFLFSDDYSYGVYCWHVKQNNNGFSFIACEENLELYFKTTFHEK